MVTRRPRKVEWTALSYGFQKISDRSHNFIQRVDEAEIALIKLINRNLKTVSTKLDALEAHGRSLHPLSTLNRGFALLKIGDHIISAHESLREFEQIVIISCPCYDPDRKAQTNL